MAIRLKNWSIFQREPGGFQAPELGAFCLQGNAYGHPRFNDGSFVCTSRIIKVEDKGKYKEVTTRSGSSYHCYKEDVDPKAEEQFPNYYDRLKIKSEE